MISGLAAIYLHLRIIPDCTPERLRQTVAPPGGISVDFGGLNEAFVTHYGREKRPNIRNIRITAVPNGEISLFPLSTP